ncbi:MAG TPA: beta-ketoacyl synthase N-terminal-like domain-containing protein [Solirubrobacteraceae bacterium]|jgi:acyl transferase domain-containing protein|nr:beta-ketoacyl synthase N-terminal-like domain-containing protein [Solirubrobacteraceae bacterium]
MSDDLTGAIAIVGMAGRFPGARDVEELWRNVLDGVEALTEFSDEELRAAGIAEALLADPSYVKAGCVLDGIEDFDAGFFGIPPREAQILDPQQRLFLEEAWCALEHAGCDPAVFDGAIGVFAGAALSTYLMHNIAQNPDLDGSVNVVQVVLGNDKDSLTTRVAHALDLRGPCFSIQSYCSTSLVAVCTAATSLLMGECDLALAGGVAISVPQRVGYFYQEGGMSSPDGRCRTFDARAEGAPIGSGVAIVALKRADDALADGDHVHALIRGWAVNNDGALKVGFTAPGVRGQAGVVAEALANAGLRPAQIGYIEAHGTGTALGDAAEVAALRQVFSELPPRSCMIGSIKTNLGHLDRAAGATGLIKAALCVEHGVIPPSLNFTTPNPAVGLTDSPFEVVTELRDWDGAAPRCAGVSAFGIGGTNAHVIVEQPPAVVALGDTAPAPEALLVSGRSAAAADAAVARLARHLGDTSQPLSDVAWTLACGRRAFAHRRAVVASASGAAAQALHDGRVLTGAGDVPARPVAFLLAGVGEHHVGMGAALYAREPVYRDAFDECAALFAAELGVDLADVLYGATPARRAGFAAMLGRESAPAVGSDPLARAVVAQPGAFAVDYATARLLGSLGIVPAAMLGYSLGEYVAACLGEVLDLRQAVSLVAERARLIEALPEGAMLAVPLAPERLHDILPAALDVAAVNGPSMVVVAGPSDSIADFEATLRYAGAPSRRLVADRAFHSRMLAPIAEPLTAWVRAHITAGAPRTPYISNVTGTWITESDVSDPAYWARHACEAVRFADGLVTLLADAQLALVEIGPGQSLGAMARGLPACTRERWPQIVSTLSGQYDLTVDETPFVAALAQLWVHGVSVDWRAWRTHRPRRRVRVPSYPFQRSRYWVEAPGAAAPDAAPAGPQLHSFTWRRDEPAGGGEMPGKPDGDGEMLRGDGEVLDPVLVFADDRGVAAELVASLREQGLDVTVVRAREAYAPTADGWHIRPGEATDYAHLATALATSGHPPRTVAHLWSLDGPTGAGLASLDAQLLSGFTSIGHIVRTLGTVGTESLRIAIVSEGVHAIAAGERGRPEQAPLLGLAKVIPQEHPDLCCRTIDIADGDLDAATHVLYELTWPAGAAQSAWRGGQRLTAQLDTPRATGGTALREGGVYIVTGGLGPVGVTLAEQLVSRCGAHVVLTSRHAPPPRATWGEGDGARSAALGRLAAADPAGTQIVVVGADVANAEQMRGALTTTIDAFGRLHGVLHAAALTDPASFRTLEHLTSADTQAHFAAKVHGALVLEEVLRNVPLDFVVLQSSISAVLGGLGFASYAAANSVLDAIASRHREDATRWLSIDWDTWQATAAKLGDVAQGTSMAEYSLSPEDAWQALGRALASDASRIVVAAGDLRARMQGWLTSQDADAGVVAAATRFPRPGLREPYVEPVAGIERTVADIWEEALGIEAIGANDGFMDLGGNSLMGLQLIARLKRELGVRLPAVALFEAPTVRALAARIAQEQRVTFAPDQRPVPAGARGSR